MITSLERSFKRQIALGVERADIAGVQPAVLRIARRGRFRIVPVARHHHVAAAEDFAGLADRQRVGPSRPPPSRRRRHRAARPSRAARASADARGRRCPAFVSVVIVIGALALPVDLREARPEAVERLERRPRHTSARRPRRWCGCLPGRSRRHAIDEPLDHGGRGEHRGAPPARANSAKDLVRLEAAGFRHDIDRRAAPRAA